MQLKAKRKSKIAFWGKRLKIYWNRLPQGIHQHLSKTFRRNGTLSLNKKVRRKKARKER